MNATDTGNDDRGHFGTDDSAQESGDVLVDGIDDGRNMGHLDEDHQHGPTDGQYFMVFWVLVVITAFEVSTYWWDDWFGDTDGVRYAATAVLFTLMAVKFVMIAGIFMHLKFDPKLLRRVFVFGLLLATIVYLVTLSTLNFWTDSGNPWFNNPPPPITPITQPEG